MALPVPKSKMVLAFLRLNGWELEKTNQQFYILKAPHEYEFEDAGFRFEIPVKEDALDYKEYITQNVFSIAQMYEWNKWDLLSLLSKSVMEIERDLVSIKKELNLKQGLLTYAS